MKLAWFKFKPEAWRSDPSLRMCSLASRGLWIEMLSLMHEAEPRGHLLVQGRPVTAKQLAGLAGCSARDAESALTEMEAAGVYSKTDDGTIYSRRMVRDTQKAERDHNNGKGGGNPKLTEGVNPPVNGGDKAKNLEGRGKNISTLKRACPKRVRTRVPYSEDFLSLWRQYPTDALMSKKLAFEAWGRLSEEDRELVMGSLAAFRAHCEANTDYRPVHLVRYLSQRRFEGFASLSRKVSASVIVREGTPQWKAWDQYFRATQGKGPPCVNGAWRFATEWPPEIHGAHAA